MRLSVSSEAKLVELAARRDRATARRHVYAEEFYYLDDQIPMCEDNVEGVAKAIPIVFLLHQIQTRAQHTARHGRVLLQLGI